MNCKKAELTEFTRKNGWLTALNRKKAALTWFNGKSIGANVAELDKKRR